MPRIYIEFARMKQVGSNCKLVSSKVDQIRSDFQRTISQLDWDIKYQSDINSTATQLARKLEGYTQALKSYQSFIDDAYGQYVKLDSEKTGDFTLEVNQSSTTILPGVTWDDIWSDYISGWFKDVLITKPYILPIIYSLISPVVSSLILNSGLFVGSSDSGSASASAGWWGYEFDEDHPGVTAWIGKASAETKNDWGYAGVNAYLGKAKAEAKADAGFMKASTKKKYQDGEWTEKETIDFLYAGASASATVSALAGDAKASAGDDMLGAEVKAEGTVGSATAEAKGEFSIGEDGVNAVASGKAMVSAAEGKASGTINILGIEITGKIGGYAGAAGVEGKIGVEDNKWVMEGGVAALLGVSGGIEIGFNDEGWSNFVDFITFWD